MFLEEGSNVKKIGKKLEILFPNDLLVVNNPCHSIGRGEEHPIIYYDPRRIEGGADDLFAESHCPCEIS